MKRDYQITIANSRDNVKELTPEWRGGHRMNILIRTDGVKLTKELREAIRTKIGRARQYAPSASRARVQIHKVCARALPDQYRAHVLYEVKGNDVSAEHTAHEPLAALDLVSEKIERRLRKRKTARLAGRSRIYRRSALQPQP